MEFIKCDICKSYHIKGQCEAVPKTVDDLKDIFGMK